MWLSSRSSYVNPWRQHSQISFLCWYLVWLYNKQFRFNIHVLFYFSPSVTRKRLIVFLLFFIVFTQSIYFSMPIFPTLIAKLFWFSTWVVCDSGVGASTPLCGLHGAVVSVVAFWAKSRGFKSTHGCSHTVQKPSISPRLFGQCTLNISLPFEIQVIV